MELVFEWDEEKAGANLKKHKVSFDEARTAFEDPFLVSFRDEAHSEGEERFISIGLSVTGKILLMSHTDGRAEKLEQF